MSEEADTEEPIATVVDDSKRKSTSRWWLALWPAYLITGIWAFGAVKFDGPLGGALAVPWALVYFAVLAVLRQPRKRLKAWTAVFGIVLLPWLLKQPSNDRDWANEWRETGRVELDGDQVTFVNLRNFDWCKCWCLLSFGHHSFRKF